MSTPRSVGIDATTWWNERGFGRFTRELVKALVARGRHRYTLVVDRPATADDLVPGADVLAAVSSKPVTETAVQAGARGPLDVLRLGRAVARAKFDVFYFPAVYAYFPVPSRVPCVVTFHDAIAERFPHLTFPTRRNALLWRGKTELAKLQAKRAMTVSEASAEDLRTVLGIHPSRIDVVTEGPDPIFRPLDDTERARAIRADLGLAPEGPLLVYVGGLNPHKNLLGLLAAMPAVHAAFPSVQLAIVGDTSGRGFYDNVDALRTFLSTHRDVAAQVKLTGFLPDERLVELLGASTAMVLPSLWEGFGLPAVEAMACGRPVLASDRGSLPEVVGDAGRLFDPDDSGSISRCIIDFIGDSAAQAELSARALVRSRKFTWERAAALAERSFELAARERN